ncbi:MAG: 50S ribosomal protein L25/general stress protein Ctc [Micavibrio sp.]|nr:50S ribosomal protein L25/general stress protein Ctc [Micavibrio sp.]HCK32320.1 50S ribosomal protein L25 [Rhodospirillaceae bacterium]
MSTRYTLKASERKGTGKGTARALRREGSVPAVIYGDNKEPVTICLDGNELTKEYMRGHLFTTVCELDLDGKKELVLARDAQLHPVKDNILHVDYLRVTKKTRIPVNVPVRFVNEETCPGLSDGGILAVARYDVEVYCSALEIPEAIEIDLAETQIHDTIKSSSIKLPSGVSFTIDRDFTIASIAEPKAAPVEDEEVAEGEEGGAAEGEASDEAAEGGDAAEEEKTEE